MQGAGVGFRSLCDGAVDTMGASGERVFLTSSFRPNFYLGAMLSLNMGACLLVSMTVLPAILNRFRPRFVYGEKM